jgi:hypothetical protein
MVAAHAPRTGLHLRAPRQFGRRALKNMGALPPNPRTFIALGPPLAGRRKTGPRWGRKKGGGGSITTYRPNLPCLGLETALRSLVRRCPMLRSNTQMVRPLPQSSKSSHPFPEQRREILMADREHYTSGATQTGKTLTPGQLPAMMPRYWPPLIGY